MLYVGNLLNNFVSNDKNYIILRVLLLLTGFRMHLIQLPHLRLNPFITHSQHLISLTHLIISFLILQSSLNTHFPVRIESLSLFFQMPANVLKDENALLEFSDGNQHPGVN